jgi:hypothetical protein
MAICSKVPRIGSHMARVPTSIYMHEINKLPTTSSFLRIAGQGADNDFRDPRITFYAYDAARHAVLTTPWRLAAKAPERPSNPHILPDFSGDRDAALCRYGISSLHMPCTCLVRVLHA